MINRIWSCYFSPSGHTEKVVTTAARAAAEALGISKVNTYDWTLPETRDTCPSFTETDLVFVATPTNAGRVPNKIMPYVRDILKGSGAFGVAITTYGNRNVDESLMELGLLMESNGFRMIGGGYACCQHVFSKIMAAGRPNADDLAEAALFGRQSAEKAAAFSEDGKCPPPFVTLGTPGHDPVGPYYKPVGINGEPTVFLKAKPKLDLDKCIYCDACIGVCPMGNITAEDISAINNPCIKCQACVLTCPTGARYFDDPAMMSHIAMLESHYGSKHGENGWFL